MAQYISIYDDGGEIHVRAMGGARSGETRRWIGVSRRAVIGAAWVFAVTLGCLLVSPRATGQVPSIDCYLRDALISGPFYESGAEIYRAEVPIYTNIGPFIPGFPYATGDFSLMTRNLVGTAYRTFWPAGYIAFNNSHLVFAASGGAIVEGGWVPIYAFKGNNNAIDLTFSAYSLYGRASTGPAARILQNPFPAGSSLNLQAVARFRLLSNVTSISVHVSNAPIVSYDPEEGFGGVAPGLVAGLITFADGEVYDTTRPLADGAYLMPSGVWRSYRDRTALAVETKIYNSYSGQMEPAATLASDGTLQLHYLYEGGGSGLPSAIEVSAVYDEIFKEVSARVSVPITFLVVDSEDDDPDWRPLSSKPLIHSYGLKGKKASLYWYEMRPRKGKKPVVYEVEVKEPGAAWKRIATVKKPFWTGRVKGDPRRTTFRVRAICGEEKSPYSKVFRFSR